MNMTNYGTIQNQGKEDKKNPIRAAQYVRMSTEHQQYSTENQRDIIKEFANDNDMVIVRTYADDGKSGLNIGGRKALKKLINDVENGKSDFSSILVYDVSRWRRFQDADESAYYEYICKRAGINVQYCAEQFKNDGSPISTMAKSFKRAMAGEYSRELSVKVFKGQCRLIEEGFRQGGSAGLGLRRMLIDQHCNQKGILKRGEYKSLQTDRVILIPGPPEEIQTVSNIYNLFVEKGMSEFKIAESLNSQGILTDLKRPWTRGSINQILSNEKYIGNNVFNRSSFKLKQKRVKNPREMWVRHDGAFEAVIDPQIFYKAQGIILERNRKFTDEEMLDRLKYLYQKHGRLSGFLIDELESMPSSAAYRSRFKGLIRAYKLIGYSPERDYDYIKINRYLRKMHPEVISNAIKKIETLGGYVKRDEKTDLLFINDEFTASLILARCHQTPAGSLRWIVRLDSGLEPDITVVLRMNVINKEPLDYYLLPQIDFSFNKLRLAEDNKIDFDAYRFDNLDYFFGMAEQVNIRLGV
ncbi:recombinase family protein [Desulfobacula sp.]|uniref:recombinase family protein n=1 Tax=Desulfobacula sp. TaxID=2593537 RepID=UPI0039B8BEB4